MNQPKKKRKKITKKTSASFVVVVLIAVLGYLWVADTGGPVSDKPAIQLGGKYELTDQNGQLRSSEEFKDKYQIIFFGFTNCPDICPVALSVITEALNQIGSDAKEVQPIFITVDPERDTPEAIKEYLTSFHPSFVGLTGDKAKIDDVEKKFKVYAETEKAEDGSNGYTVYHSGMIYIMDKKGNFLYHFSNKDSAESIAQYFKDLM